MNGVLTCLTTGTLALVSVLSATTAATSATPTTSTTPATSAKPTTPATSLQSAGPGLTRVCGSPAPGFASCNASINAVARANAATTKPRGFGPADIRSAYHLPAAAGAGTTVAIVDAYDDPTAERDLAVYRRTYGLPACTRANGCLRKVSQTGTAVLPKVDAGWAVEISLDLDMVSASCPRCKILLVEATSSAMTDLAKAVDYAATQHVSAISNSYSSTDTKQTAAYDHPGIAITAATGDTGYGFGAPASFRTVIAVGGTSLRRAHNARGWTETAWSSSSSGCSTLNSRPEWQTATRCRGKAAADVSAVADPNTGVAMYDSTPVQGTSGWRVSGGTSAAAPIIAGVYAMSRHTAGYPASYTWAHASALNDVKRGASSRCPKVARSSCVARSGWDGPTGLGTPNGTAGF